MLRRNQSRLDETITVPADKFLWDAVRELADDERRKLAPMARILIEEALEARGVLIGSEETPVVSSPSP